MLSDTLSSDIVYGTDVSLQPIASKASVFEHRAPFTFLESTDQLVVVQNFVYCQVVTIGKNIRVRDMVLIMRPSETHEYIQRRQAELDFCRARTKYPDGVTSIRDDLVKWWI